MLNKKLHEQLNPYVSPILSNFLTAGITIVDDHSIISAYSSTFPVSYTQGLTAFKGNKQLFHAYLGRMLCNQKFGYAHLMGFVNSLNCKGNKSRNSLWQLI